MCSTVFTKKSMSYNELVIWALVGMKLWLEGILFTAVNVALGHKWCEVGELANLCLQQDLNLWLLDWKSTIWPIAPHEHYLDEITCLRAYKLVKIALAEGFVESIKANTTCRAAGVTEDTLDSRQH